MLEPYYASLVTAAHSTAVRAFTGAHGDWLTEARLPTCVHRPSGGARGFSAVPLRAGCAFGLYQATWPPKPRLGRQALNDPLAH